VSAPHFFAGAPPVGGGVVLKGEEARHAARSLRLRPGDAITSGDGRGAVAACVVERAGRDEVEARVEERWEVPPPEPALTVLMAPPKGERLSWAVQKLVELGVDAIVPLESGRTVRRPGGTSRLVRVAREAAKQSRRAWLPVLGEPVDWEAASATRPPGLRVVLWERAEPGLLGLLPEEPPPAVELLVGPEGGISEAEARQAESGGAVLASLGPTLLRTETAALAGAAIVLAAVGRMGS
jgi:16S rRNA (uracil1498-N3)-methyltransferase